MNKHDYLIGLLIILVTVLPTNLASQIESCTLIDSLSKEPVAYASVSSGSYQNYTDEQGVFFTKEFPSDTIQISRLGFKSISISKSELTSTIYLTPKNYEIPEIVVSANAVSFDLGYHRLNSIWYTGWGHMKTFHAVYIQKPKQRCKIRKVLAHTRNNREGAKFVIGLFEVNENGFPGDLIFSKEHESPKGRNMLEVSVDEANLVLPENGIFVAIKSKDTSSVDEDSNDHKLLRSTNKLDSCMSYFHYDNQWWKFDIKELDHKVNYKIGLEVIPF